MTLINVLIDTNVCLDGIFNHEPFAAHALELTERAQRGDFRGFVAAHSFDTIFYVLKKRIGRAKTYKGIKSLRKAYNISPVTENVIDKAIENEWKDFEDAIHYQAAVAAGCQAIITRNEKDFKKTEIPILTPQEFLDQLGDNEDQ
jgi:predicted nucleic acid-binding protein